MSGNEPYGDWDGKRHSKDIFMSRDPMIRGSPGLALTEVSGLNANKEV